MPLHHTSPDDPGWSRRRAGRGFSYRGLDGSPITGADRDRITRLAIPPAWTEVWICPDPDGHLQAVGTDEAGRRQYLYHPRWRDHRDAEKFRRVQEFGARLPQVRRRVTRDLTSPEPSLAHSCALALRLVDEGSFRIGSDVYAEEHGSFGLTTLERRHVRRHGDALRFRFVGKSGVEHDITVTEPTCVRDLSRLRRRRGGDFDQLLAFKEQGQWARLAPESVNGYLQEVAEMAVTIKDFRTWHATVLAAHLLAGPTAASGPGSRSVVRTVMEQVGDFLGNTPAVARASYVDPRVVDRYEGGRTIPRELARRESRRDRSRVERAVLELLNDPSGP